MTSEQAIGVLGAGATLVGALIVLVRELRGLRGDLNGRLQQLLEAATAAARKEGELAGRDYTHRLYEAPIAPRGVVTPPPSAPLDGGRSHEGLTPPTTA